MTRSTDQREVNLCGGVSWMVKELTLQDGWDIAVTKCMYRDVEEGWNSRVLLLSYRVSRRDVSVYGRNIPDLADQLDLDMKAAG